MKNLIFLSILALTVLGGCKKKGCIDSNSTNYISDAEKDDGSCAYTVHLGKDTLGGIVYFIYLGSDGSQHGLIVNKTESTAVWQAIGGTTGTLTNADRSEDGAYNTALMTSSAAANYVNRLTDGGFSDWYLPSIDELSLLWYSRLTTNKALRAGSFTLLSTRDYYWSSTELNATLAYAFMFHNGDAAANDKSFAGSVRAVRAF